MSIAIACSQCGRTLQSTGVRGLCPRCLFACTTARLPVEDERSSPDGAGTEDVLEFGQSIGPDGRFELLDKLGEGGMGEVWLANDQALSQGGEPEFVALKFLAKSIRGNPRALAALRSEVLRSQRLSHPNIVRIYDLHTTQDGKPFIKMEFVEGNSLRRWLDEQPEHVMPWRMAALITQQLASALRYAHETEGIVHRDIKPGNLLLHMGPVVKLSDFGIAAAAHIRPASGHRELELGTLWYASPQQLAGQPPSPEDDIYALGATLYELLTGSLPFEASLAEELVRKVQYEPPEPIAERLRALGRRNEVPGKMLILVQKCLEKEPRLRPKAQEILHRLPLALDAANPVLATSQTSAVSWAEEPAPPKPARWGILVFIITLLVLATLMAWQDWWGLPTQVKKLIGIKVVVPNNPHGPLPSQPPPLTPPVPPVPPPPVTTPSDGGVSNGTVRLCLARNAGQPPIHYEVRGETVGSSNGRFPEAGIESFPVPPGNYSFFLRDSHTPPWTLEARAIVGDGQTQTLMLAFCYGDLTVTSEPSGAEVSWTPDVAVARDMPTQSRTPFTNRFRSGSIQLNAALRGYESTHETNDFYFHYGAGGPESFNIVLQQRPVPLTERPFTNSLGMEFIRVAQHLWACSMETRVGDFEEFVNESNYDAREGMYSVTANGWRQAGFWWKNPGFAQTRQHPVIGLNWADAVRFCEWLTEHERRLKRLLPDQSYRLPRTNEWFELAGGRIYPWGDAARPVVGNYSGSEVTHSDWPPPWPWLEAHTDGFARTAPVKAPEFKANELGFYHLGGNAAEWCEEKVLCGGSWCDGESGDVDYLKTRSIQVPRDCTERHDRNGFRVVIVEPETGSKSKR